jgi:uncharacterized membrane protein
MKPENQFEFMKEYLKRENIRIDFEEYKFQTETHPDFPSLLSFSESLSFFNVDNIATRVPKDQLDNLPDRFIALIESKDKGSFLTVVERQIKGIAYLTNGSMQLLDKPSFLDIWSGIVLVAEQTENTIEAKPKTTWLGKMIVPLLLLFTFLITLSSAQFPYIFSAFAVFSVLGIFLASEALKQEFGIKNTISAGVCNATPTTDCHAVINSEKTKILGKLSLSDISIIYFSSQFLSLLILGPGKHASSFLQITVLSLLLAIPVTLFSFYYQYAIAKKWCPVCLGIAGTLYAQFIVLFFGIDSLIAEFNITGLLSVATIYLFMLFLWLTTKPKLKEFFTLKTDKLENMRFRRNYSLFKNALKASREVDEAIMSSHIQLGNADASLQISMVTNPFCKFCEAAHEAIYTIMKRNEKEVGISLRFNVNPDKTEEKSILLHQGFMDIYQRKGGEALMQSMDEWFNLKDVDRWLSKYSRALQPDPEIMEIFKKEYEENAKNELLFTPAIIVNRHLYPKMYYAAELSGFISELVEDDEILTGNTSMEVI